MFFLKTPSLIPTAMYYQGVRSLVGLLGVFGLSRGRLIFGTAVILFVIS